MTPTGSAIAGNPAPRYVVFDELDSGWNPPPSDPLTFVEQRHPGTTYRQVYESNFVYVFRRRRPGRLSESGSQRPIGGVLMSR